VKTRYIPKYLCLICHIWQIQEPTNLYKSNDNVITRLFCNNCKKWIPVKSTSLFVGQRFIIEILQYPSIIDNDCSYNKIIFQELNLNALSKICLNYNSKKNYTFTQACIDYQDYIEQEVKMLI